MRLAETIPAHFSSDRNIPIHEIARDEHSRSVDIKTTLRGDLPHKDTWRCLHTTRGRRKFVPAHQPLSKGDVVRSGGISHGSSGLEARPLFFYSRSAFRPWSRYCLLRANLCFQGGAPSRLSWALVPWGSPTLHLM